MVEHAQKVRNAHFGLLGILNHGRLIACRVKAMGLLHCLEEVASTGLLTKQHVLIGQIDLVVHHPGDFGQYRLGLGK